VRKLQWRRLEVSDKARLKFRVRGKELESYKVDRWMKRYKIPDDCLYVPSPVIREWSLNCDFPTM
jgi:hypothetical protein